MTCSAFEYSSAGRRGIGVNQPQSGLHYPFVNPSEDIRYLIADFYLAYEDLAEAISHPLKISWLYGLGCVPSAGAYAPTHAADIVVTDANNNVVFSSIASADVSFDAWDWGARHAGASPSNTYDYRIYEWISGSSVCRLVAYKTWPVAAELGNDEDVARNYTTHITPNNGTIDERAIYKMPKRVNAIYVSNGKTAALGSAAAIKLAGEIDFEYGYNTTLTVSEQQTRGVRATRQVTLNAAAGSGKGKYTDCDTTTPPIYEINGLTGPNILLGSSDCLWLNRPTTLVGTALTVNGASSSTARAGCVCPTGANTPVWQINSNCPACCTCDDYVNLGLYMNSEADRYRVIGRIVRGEESSVVEKHSDNIDRWIRQQECRLQKPLHACMTPQRCPYIDVLVQYCNKCSACAPAVTLSMSFATSNGNTAETVCGFTSITTSNARRGLATLGGSWPVFQAAIGKVDIGNSAEVQFRLRFNQSAPTDLQLVVTGQITQENGAVENIIAGCDGTDTAEFIIVKSLYCGDDGSTVIPSITCGPTTASSSSSI